MKGFLQIFCVALTIGFLVGLIEGQKERDTSTDESKLQEAVLRHFHYKKLVDSNGLPQVKLSYVCNGIEYYSHIPSLIDDHGEYVGDLTVSVDEPTGKLGENLELIFITATGIHANELIVLLSGGALEEEAVKWNVKKVVAVILGTATGFYFGRWITARGEVACDSPRVLAGLKDNSLWLSSMRTLIKNLLARTIILQLNRTPEPLIGQLSNIEQMLKAYAGSNDQGLYKHECSEQRISPLRALAREVNDPNYRIKSLQEFRLALNGPSRALGCLNKDDLGKLFPHYVGWAQKFTLIDEVSAGQRRVFSATARAAEEFMGLAGIFIVVVPILAVLAGLGFLLVRFVYGPWPSG
jgi:hypothetical protein